MTEFRADDYSTPSRHPLIVMLVNPIGSLFSLGFPPPIVARWLNCLFGALGVGLAFLVFERWREGRLFPALLAALFGVTMSQMFFGSLPETYSLAACTLLITYALTIISVRQQQLDFWPWVVTGVLTMGITATNVVQSTICFAFAAEACRKGSGRPVLPQVLLFTLVVGAAVVALSLIQKAISPAADLFFWPFDHRVSLGYVDFSPLLHPLDLLAREMKHFVLVNFVGAVPQEIPWPGTALPALTFDAPLALSPLGWIGTFLWMIIFTAGAVSAAWHSGSDRVILKALLACLSFNFLLHMFYATGTTSRAEFFLYSAHWTFAVLFLVTSTLPLRRIHAVLAVALIGVLAANNLGIMSYMLEVYSRF